ncbi:MAG TPA: site-2 protease family protein [Candidatus Paceibacterota bacterium]|nr:site-2 protease family protein [Candidatus Paceibacterota bacterium]
MPTDLIFSVLILIVSVILHEVAHGYMANWLGDPTARLQGRLTLNPISHIDPIGTIILPAILVFTHSPILIGYAKPVPYNPYNLKGKYDEGLVAFAGPGTNILLALIFGLTIRFFGGALDQELLQAFALITYINMLLALFNLIPIPPLDGSKVLSSILPGELGRWYDSFRANFERLGTLSGTLLLLFIFYYFLSPFFGAALQNLFALLTGVSI